MGPRCCLSTLPTCWAGLCTGHKGKEAGAGSRGVPFSLQGPAHGPDSPEVEHTGHWGPDRS